VVIARLFNTVGPRQTGRYGMVIPRFVAQALAGEAITVYGDGQQSRCFCDVADATQALGALIEHQAAVGRVFNVGSTEEVTIAELAARVKQVTGSQSPIRFIPYDQAYTPGFEDMRRRVPDTGRIRALCGWRAQTTLDHILARVAASMSAQTSPPPSATSEEAGA
jgi:UDP-glucose 4-epimerase